jgi:hypothetical protein
MALFREPTKLICCVLMGTALFWLIGKLVHHSSLFASEVFHSRRREKPYFGALGYRWGTLVIAVLIIALVLAVEVVVERQGVVRAMESQDLAVILHAGKSPQPPPSWIYWLIAVIVAGPYVFFHTVEGWRDARGRIAARERQAVLGIAIEEHLSRPEVKEVSAAVGLANEAEQRYRLCPSEGASPDVRLALELLQEATERRASHPELTAIQTLLENKRGRLGENLTIQEAEAACQRAQQALSGDLVVLARRQHLEAIQASPVHAYTVGEAERRLTAVQQRMEADPRVLLCRDRVERKKAELGALDQDYVKACGRLESRCRKILLSPSKIMRARIQEAYDEWQAAQMQFDREFERVRRILEAPNRWLRFLERVREQYGEHAARRLVRAVVVSTVVALVLGLATTVAAIAVVLPRLQ